VSLPAEALSIAALEEELLDRYGARLQSVAYGDILLYASFLPDAAYLSSLTLAQLLARSKSREEEEGSDNDSRMTISVDTESDENMSDDPSDPLSATLDQLTQKKFIDIDIACIDEDGNDIRLPAVRVKCGLPSLDDDDDDDNKNDDDEQNSPNSRKHKNRKSKHLDLYESIKDILLKFCVSLLG